MHRTDPICLANTGSEPFTMYQNVFEAVNSSVPSLRQCLRLKIHQRRQRPLLYGYEQNIHIGSDSISLIILMAASLLSGIVRSHGIDRTDELSSIGSTGGMTEERTRGGEKPLSAYSTEKCHLQCL
jgi:hypothetical protein